MNLGSGIIRRLAALRGFRHLGVSWARPYLGYLFKPLLGFIWGNKEINVGGILARSSEADLYVIGNLFTDYNFDKLKEFLRDADTVIDAGANIGAFSWLVHKIRPSVKIIAIEPSPENCKLLSRQPFAQNMSIVQAALSHNNTPLMFKYGASTAGGMTTNDEGDFQVKAVTLSELVTNRTLLKMDIEGGELSVLNGGIPENVVRILMEWHYKDAPNKFFETGVLTCEGTDGDCSYWSWVR